MQWFFKTNKIIQISVKMYGWEKVATFTFICCVRVKYIFYIKWTLSNKMLQSSSKNVLNIFLNGYCSDKNAKETVESWKLISVKFEADMYNLNFL